MKIRSMQTCIMSSLPRCIFRCSVFRYVTLVSFFLFFLFKLCYLIVTLLLWWRINTYLLDSVNLQELFTVTKDLQQNTKSFLEQMNKQMTFLMTHVLQEKQLPKQIPIYPQAPSPPVLPRMQPLYQPTHTGLLNQYTLNHFP